MTSIVRRYRVPKGLILGILIPREGILRIESLGQVSIALYSELARFFFPFDLFPSIFTARSAIVSSRLVLPPRRKLLDAFSPLPRTRWRALIPTPAAVSRGRSGYREFWECSDSKMKPLWLTRGANLSARVTRGHASLLGSGGSCNDFMRISSLPRFHRSSRSRLLFLPSFSPPISSSRV